ncbi:MAG: glycine cleavage system protein T [Bacillus thermozeamaize]|uniref:Aminomethyltransferase n=1 Tax=Bacillus thermozeamaize TaxID=230954 RepID=A0A1Y3PSW6_9BACI|nr:MAG: glycine cleavage system protein T [Bacillus thermozeamaize]
MEGLQKTPLFSLYERYGGKVVDFHGWSLPVQFSGILKEHQAVRTRAGLFDVSHMGRLEVRGPGALSLLNHLVTNQLEGLAVNRSCYTPLCSPDGGTVDDTLVYRMGEEHFLLVVNAANREKDLAWIQTHATGGHSARGVTKHADPTAGVSVADRTNEWALLAFQGPLAAPLLQSLTDADLSKVAPFAFLQHVRVADIPVAMLSRTGYTGEDGFELMVRHEDAARLWERLLEAGEPHGVIPCGLGARDTLRFEAGLPLYGQELSPEISPLEAGLGFAVKWEKGEFIGREALLRQKEEGVPRRLVGLEMLDKGIPRTGYPVFAGDRQIGRITSGTYAPTLKKNLGMALIRWEYAQMGQHLEVEVRGKRLRAQAVKKPFYRRQADRSR